MKILIVEARFYSEIADAMYAQTENALKLAGANVERLAVPGALEIPTAIAIAAQTEKYDGYVALGCVMRGETYHFDIVANESARGLMDLGIRKQLAIGNGILTVENEEQALARINGTVGKKGEEAVAAVLSLITYAKELGIR